MAKPSSWIPHIEAFVDPSPSDEQNASIDAIASLVKNDLLTIDVLVREMEMYLTTTDNVIRARGILLLAELITRLTSKTLDKTTKHSLIGFFTERLADWQALRGAIIGCLALLRRKSNSDMVIDSDARAVTQSFLNNIQVQSLGQHDRKLCFELLECLLDSYPDAVASLGDDLIYGICEAIDGEKDPRCLMLTFHLVEALARLFPEPSGLLTNFAGDLFDILGRYFPIHFTHPKSDDFDVTRNDLSRALMFAFSSTPVFEPFAIPLLLEKLSSSLPSAKVDSLKYLGTCALKYGVDRMERHAKAIWSCLKDAICTSSQENTFFMVSESPDGIGFQENEIAKETLICLHNCILQNESLFLSLIVEDEDIDIILRSVTSCNSYTDLSPESKQKLRALGHMLSVSVKASMASCNRMFQSFFPRLIDILGLTISTPWEFISNGSCALSQRLNYGALYLCIELLAACRDLLVGSEELAPPSVSAQDTWCCLLQNFSVSLTGALSSTLVTSINQNVCEEDIYCGVKGLKILATFPGFLPISKPLFENILMTFVSIITVGYERILLRKLTLKALLQIGTFIEKYHDSEKALGYMNIVVEKFVSMITHDDFAMPFPLKLEAMTDIGATGSDFMLRVTQGLEEAISANFLEVFVKGNLKLVEVLVPLLECYSSKVLAWFQKAGGFEKVALHFAVNIWNQMENSMAFNVDIQGKELLDATMEAMRMAVGICSVENQGLIVEKAFSVLSSITSFPLEESMPFSFPVNLEGLQLTQDLDSSSCRDEWLISLCASVIIAVHPQTRIPNLRVILELFMTGLLKGHVPAAQALGSIVNKLPVKISTTDVSCACTLEEAVDTIFKMNLWSTCGNALLRKCSALDGNEEDIVRVCLNLSSNVMVQTRAMVGLAWIGKGLLMRGHEKVKDIMMGFLRCLLGDGGGQDIHPLVMRSAADAFHTLLSDSEVCLNKRCHATIRPLYKQHFFSIMLPILLSSIVESDSSISRSMLHRAFGHVISEAPLIAVVAEAKKLIPVLLDGLSMLSVDILDKELTYSLLLVLSGILMDENGQEAVTENAHIIINRVIGLAFYSHMTLVRETAIQCLVALCGLPHVRIYPMRTQVLRAVSKALDDPKRTVRQEAVRCRQAWASIASRSLRF